MRVELPCKAGLPIRFTNNLSTGKSTSIRSIIKAVERVTGRAVPVVHAARRIGDPPVLGRRRLPRMCLLKRGKKAGRDIVYCPKFSKKCLLTL